MKLRDVYKLAVRMGMEADPRGLENVTKELEKTAKAFKEVKEEDKEFFDMASLTNPYDDSRLLLGDGEEEIKKIFTGVDIETQEVMIADRLNQKGENIDLLISHHPEGRGLAGLPGVMNLQTGYMAAQGVRINVAEGMISSRISEVERSVGGSNLYRAVDAARLLGFPFMCVHTPADNLANKYLDDVLKKEQPQTIRELLKVIRNIPEYNYYAKNGNAPFIVSGDSSRSVGKIFVDFTGGTSGHKDNYARLADAGISTVVCMHVPESQVKWAKENYLNIVIAGHMASDSLGMNQFLDEVEKQGVDIVPASGLVRIKRY